MILITGATGLVGSHLLAKILGSTQNEVKALYRTEESLKDVKKVIAYYHDNFDKLFDSIQWVKGDITDVNSLEIAFEGVTHVYHCAAFISFDPKDEKKMLKINVEGTANMVNQSLASGVDKFCYVSSIASLGKSNENKCANEDDIWNPNLKNSSYAITKNGGEMEVWRAIEEGLNAVIVNPSVILGSGFWNMGSGKFFSQIDNGLRFYTNGSTGFVGVEDVVETMILLMQSDVKSERFIINSENLKYKEILFLISDKLKRKRPSIKISKFLIDFAWRIDAILGFVFGKKRLLSKDSAKSAVSNTCYSNHKISKELNYKFTEIEKVISDISNIYKKEN